MKSEILEHFLFGSPKIYPGQNTRVKSSLSKNTRVNPDDPGKIPGSRKLCIVELNPNARFSAMTIISIEMNDHNVWRFTASVKPDAGSSERYCPREIAGTN